MESVPGRRTMVEKKILLAAALLVRATALFAQQPDTLRLSLPEAVERALGSSDEIRLAAATTDVADAQLVTARADALPQLRFSGTYSHVFESARAQAVGQIFNQPNTYNMNANLSQTIFQGGRGIAGWRAASRVREASRLTERESRSQVALDAQRRYLDALLAQRLVEIQQGNLELADEQYRQVQQLEARGRASRYDVLRAKVQRANLEPPLILARNDRELAVLELKRLLNVPAERPLALVTAIDADALPPFVDRLEADSAVVERPSLRAAQLQAQASHDAVSIARAALMPTVSVFVQTGLQAFPRDNVLPPWRGRLDTVACPEGTTAERVCTEQNGGFFPDRSLGVQVSWPLFDGLRNKGQIDLAQARARLADLQAAQESEAVAIERAQASAGLEAARSLFEARHQNAAEAAEAYRLASLRFSRGLSTQLEVSDAQLALMTAEINEARSVHELYLAAAELARARGNEIPLPPMRAVTPDPSPEPGLQ